MIPFYHHVLDIVLKVYVFDTLYLSKQFHKVTVCVCEKLLRNLLSWTIESRHDKILTLSESSDRAILKDKVDDFIYCLLFTVLFLSRIPLRLTAKCHDNKQNT